MATFETSLVKKALRHRGTLGGAPKSVTGVLRVEAGDSIATTDLIRFIPLGENVRPIRVILTALPVSGTPVLTNATFSIGVAPIGGTFTRPDTSTYAAVTADTNQLVASMAIDADNMKQDVEVARATATAAFGPFYVTATPAGAGAFSVAGGNIDLMLTVEFIGETKEDGYVYTEYSNTKVSGA